MVPIRSKWTGRVLLGSSGSSLGSASGVGAGACRAPRSTRVSRFCAAIGVTLIGFGCGVKNTGDESSRDQLEEPGGLLVGVGALAGKLRFAGKPREGLNER